MRTPFVPTGSLTFVGGNLTAMDFGGTGVLITEVRLIKTRVDRSCSRHRCTLSSTIFMLKSQMYQVT